MRWPPLMAKNATVSGPSSSRAPRAATQAAPCRLRQISTLRGMEAVRPVQRDGGLQLLPLEAEPLLPQAACQLPPRRVGTAPEGRLATRSGGGGGTGRRECGVWTESCRLPQPSILRISRNSIGPEHPALRLRPGKAVRPPCLALAASIGSGGDTCRACDRKPKASFLTVKGRLGLGFGSFQCNRSTATKALLALSYHHTTTVTLQFAEDTLCTEIHDGNRRHSIRCSSEVVEK